MAKNKKKDIQYGVLTIILLILLILSIIYFRINQGENMDKKIIVFETNKGNFEVELDQENAPISSENFLAYVDSVFYNGLIFHRVIDDFMIQGGGFDKDMNKKDTKPPIKNEAGNELKNLKYTIAMARTNVVDSATSQFFINVKDNSFLDHRDETDQGFGYAVFGKVVSGFEIIDQIKSVETNTLGTYADVPVEPVIMEKVYVN